jgi:hypothetical protein
MTRAVGALLALFLVSAPIANDFCRLDCVQNAPPSCHRHQPSHDRDRCGHDHSAFRADIARASVSPPTLVALAVLAPIDLTARTFTVESMLRFTHSPPGTPARPIALRI